MSDDYGPRQNRAGLGEWVRTALLFATLLAIPGFGQTQAPLADPLRPHFGRVSPEAPHAAGRGRINLELQAIITGPSGAVTVINGVPYQVGDWIGPYEILDIRERLVTLATEDNQVMFLEALGFFGTRMYRADRTQPQAVPILE